MKKISIIVALILGFTAIVSAAEKPTSKETARVINYYHNGMGNGAILMESKLCMDVNKDEPNKNECNEIIPGNKVNQGDEVFLWLNFLIPAGDEASVLVGYSRDNVTRNTQHLKLPGATRFRTWKRIPTNQIGDWKVTVLQEMSNDDI